MDDQGGDIVRAPSREPIFILGSQRSGTNYLLALIAQHADCLPAAPIHEDHLLHYADLLRGYADAVAGSWTSTWGVPAEERAHLLRRLGDGVVAFLQDGRGDKRVVTKTPNVKNLELFFECFPAASLLLLVRDGRNVVASHVRSFDVKEEVARRRWAIAGRAILDFEARHRGGGRRYRIVRYEDLLDDLHGTMIDIMRSCELDPDRYDFERADRLPVYGSSTSRAEGGTVHWEPVERTPEFRPNERWRDWAPYQHARFERVAGDVQRALGYDLEASPQLTVRDRIRGGVDSTSWRVRRIHRALARKA